MSAPLKPVVAIGDAIIDAIRTSDAPPTPYPGGAALDLAVGLARLDESVEQPPPTPILPASPARGGGTASQSTHSRLPCTGGASPSTRPF
jgi:hypothetical protein